MAIPESIRSIARPKNTIVKMIGDKYAVIERVGCARKNGKNIPINGSVIGHIVDGIYVPKEDRKECVTMKDYGDYVLFCRLSRSILGELTSCYGADMAKDIYAISVLRAMNPSLRDYQVGEAYESSYLSVDMPDLSLSKNRVSTLISGIGKDYSKALLFMQHRVEGIDERNRIAIDGMLKPSNGRTCSLSDFSYKSRIRSSKDISIILAFNTTTKDIICSLPYSGNCVDMTSFPDFIEKTGISKGIIVGDKGMNDGTGIDGIGYIFPLKRSSKVIEKLGLLGMDSKIEDRQNPILCRKAESDGRFYYAFKDLKRAAKEQQDFVSRKGFSIEGLKKKEARFGAVVYVSDQDMSCREAYDLYRDRWEIELVNRFYKDVLELDTVREHGDYSVYGSEFVNLISSIIANRVKNEFADKGLYEQYTYGQLTHILRKCKKIQSPRIKGDWITTKLTKKEEEILSKLGI